MGYLLIKCPWTSEQSGWAREPAILRAERPFVPPAPGKRSVFNLRAATHLHRLLVAHLDIKAHNLCRSLHLLRCEVDVKLMDFDAGQRIRGHLEQSLRHFPRARIKTPLHSGRGRLLHGEADVHHVGRDNG